MAASLMGIHVRKMVLFSFALSAALGAVAGIVITPISLMDYDRGPMLAVKGFCAAVLGGLGVGYGAVLGGFIVGILESLTAGLIHSGFKDAVALVILLFILCFKPSGIFGSEEVSKIKKF
jgi:branched-chain amino acid transport system permease protein